MNGHLCKGPGSQFAAISSKNRLLYGTVEAGQAVEVCHIYWVCMYTHSGAFCILIRLHLQIQSGELPDPEVLLMFNTLGELYIIDISGYVRSLLSSPSHVSEMLSLYNILPAILLYGKSLHTPWCLQPSTHHQPVLWVHSLTSPFMRMLRIFVHHTIVYLLEAQHWWWDILPG